MIIKGLHGDLMNAGLTEGRVDALICAWSGIEHLEGRTIGLGDSTAAIWVP